MRFGLINNKNNLLEKSGHNMFTFPLRVALVVFLYGVLFKLMYWPYAQTLMLYSSVVIVILYSIRFLFKTEKDHLDYIKLGLVVIWVFNYIVNVFHLFNLPYIFEIILLVLFVWWFINEGFSYFTRRKLMDNSLAKFFYYGLSITSLTLIISGVLFKIQHWPYGSLMFALGVLFLSFVLILDLFVVKKQSIT
jgi:hypothetical protein